MSSQPEELYRLAQKWARAGEYQAALLVIEGLWKKQIHKDYKIFEALVELLEKSNILQAYNLLNEILSGAEDWHSFWSELPKSEQAHFYEWHAHLAFMLKDEIAAQDSLRRAAALGRDSLSLWSLIALLACTSGDTVLSLKSLHYSIKLYQEPTLLKERPIGNFLSLEQVKIDEGFFASLSLNLMPLLSGRDKARLHQSCLYAFPKRKWAHELQEFVAKEFQNQPIGLSGEPYASFDTQNR